MSILRVKDLAAYLGLHRDTIYEMRRAGKLPQPFQITERVVGWHKEEIDAWLESNRKKQHKFA